MFKYWFEQQYITSFMNLLNTTMNIDIQMELRNHLHPLIILPGHYV